MCAERGRGAARAALAALLLAGVGAATAACGSESERDAESEPNAKTAAAPQAPAPATPDAAIVPRQPLEPPAAAAAEMAWLLTLDVAEANEIEVLAGTPLVFSVSLTGAGAGSPGRLGGAEKPWHAHVFLELAESGEPAPWRVLALAQRSLVFERAGAGGGSARLEDASEAVVAPGRVHLLTLAIEPEEAVQMRPGRYALQAVVLRPDRTGEAARVESEPVAVVVLEKAEDPATRAVLERRRALGEADFYVRAGRFEEAQRVAAQLVLSEPADATARVLLGDAAAGLHQDEQARDAYLAALQLLAGKGELDEAPQALIQRLSKLEERLAPAEQATEAASEAH